MVISLQPLDRSARNLEHWCTLALPTTSALKISYFQKCKMADGRHLGKLKNSHNSATVWPIHTKFGTVIHVDLPNRNGSENFVLLTIQDGGQPPSWKSIYGYISAMVRPSAHNLARLRILALQTRPAEKISNFKNPTCRTVAILKIEKKPYLCNGFTDQHEIWHGGVYWPPQPNQQ